MSVADCDKQLFHAACEKVMRQQCPQKGIGTLSEKTVHAVLKNFYETDPAHQEIPVENYVADILSIIHKKRRNGFRSWETYGALSLHRFAHRSSRSIWYV